MSSPLKPWQKYLGVLLVGIVVGALGLRVVESLTVDQRLAEDLRHREQALAEGQSRLQDEATRLHQQSARAAELVDQVLQAQGSATERLKKVIATVKALKETLESSAP
jgi:uncharacterized membrane-anchored protein YhcB (DUF1043 family)